MVALIPIFGSRLPPGTGAFAAQCIGFTLFVVGVAVVWVALRPGDRASFALESVLPWSLAFAGAGFFALAASVLINLDAHSYQIVYESPVGLAILISGVFTTYGLGRYLGSTAAIGRLRREAASSRRVAWLTEVGVDRSWRLTCGLLLGVPTAILIVWVLGSPTPSPVLAVWLAINWAIGVVAGQQAAVFINDAGIRVSGRLFLGAPSWSLPIAQVASTRVTTARPSIMFRPGRCILRSGPALEVRSVSGRAYAVSLPEAQEAVSLLNRLAEQRGQGLADPDSVPRRRMARGGGDAARHRRSQ
jgi:cbb3-type cytochrome oxidase subunit 3